MLTVDTQVTNDWMLFYSSTDEQVRLVDGSRSKVLDEEEDHVDMVQAAAKVLGGGMSGPVLERENPVL